MKAKFPGFCPRCNKRFVVGQDEIKKDEVDGKWKHEHCTTAANYQAKQKQLVGKSYTSGVNVPLSIETSPIITDDDFDNLDLGGALIDENEDQANRTEFKSFIPSRYQQDIFDFISNSSGHAVIEAVAGSGKTTTIVKALDLTPKNAKVAFIAFNKHIADELSRRAPKHVYVSTLHSLGLGVIRRISPRLTIDSSGNKVSEIMDKIWPVSKQALNSGLITREQRKQNFIKRNSMRNLVSICKSTLTDEKDVAAVLDVIDRYNVEIDLTFMDEIISYLPSVIDQCKSNLEVIDFDDMPWLPVVLNIKCDDYDFVMVDEAQDMSKGNIAFILKCVKPTGRIIAVGDRFQSLYAFRGADSEAIPTLIEKLNATVLPLSVTYRCPASHVRRAQEIVPQLTARDNAPEGTIIDMEYIDLLSVVQPGDMVICRTNAPLIRPAFECIRRGMKAIIRGKDIGSALIQLIKRFETDDLGSFEVSLTEYFEHEHTKLMDKGKELQAAMLVDKVETLRFIINECSTVTELMAKINMLFNDNNIGVIFSSVHRAKGLEAEKVYILRPELMPHPKAKKEWELQQEMNCKYVAETRSKNEMIFVLNSDKV